MATIQVPPNVSSVTFVTSGVKTPVAGLITGINAAELTDVTSPYSWGPACPDVITSNISTGAVDMTVPSSITSITINGNVKAVASGKISAVAAADAAAFILAGKNQCAPFDLVQA